MDIILVPGLWLDGSSWKRVTPHLEKAGHRTHPITLPGMESPEADRSEITRQDHVGAVVAAIDAVDEPVVLVGHSMSAGIAHAAVDARPDRVVLAIYIGGFPSADGSSSGDFTVVDGEIPMPDFSEFDDADLTDLDEEGLADLREQAIPSPSRVATDPQRLSDDRRYDVPVIAVCPEYTAEMLQGWVDKGYEPVAEFAKIRDVTYVDLPTGHWPQFTKPTELAQIILDAMAGNMPK